MTTFQGREFKSGKPYERYSAEKKRRHIAGAQLGYGAGALGAGTVAAGVSGAKLAGTRSGQAGLTAAHTALGSKHPAAHNLRALKRVGQFAAKHNRASTVVGAGAAATAVGSKMVHGWRKEENVGISQSIGRVKAGNTYQRKQQRVEKLFNPISLGMTAAKLADVNWKSPGILRAVKTADRHKGKIVGGAAAAGTLAAGAGATKMTTNRRRETKQLRAALHKSAFGVDHGC